MKKLIFSAKTVKLIGRTFQTETNFYPIHSGSGCSFIFSGKKLDIILSYSDNEENHIPECNKPRFAVMVNGKFVIKKVIEKQGERYSLISSNDAVSAKIDVIKLSEAAFSLGCLSFEADENAEISPAPSAQKRIGFIGDSITCGYGVDDCNVRSDFSTSAENAMKSYAYLTAGLLGTEYSLFSYSGHGVISGWTETGKRNEAEILPPFYEYLGRSCDTICGRRIQDMKWDFSQFPFDIIVLNLGTNDNNFCLANESAPEEFEETYYKFLKTIRRCSPDSHITACINIIETSMYKHICNAAERFRQYIDGRISTFSFTPQKGLLGYGSQWHPSEDTQAYAAAELADYIRNHSLLD